ncbi:MAG: prepilin-type N-terminal cleavage/methylation domain-containing protein [Candidatus Desulfofervidaceae bacterium]|nr:prepilin-type N-terminal cleavage/methylation domain-containing protein [Candidatus Desulfofervidaceae bacterium]
MFVFIKNRNKRFNLYVYRTAGFTLIELLVTCVIAALFLLGLSYFSVNFNTAYDKDQARVELHREGNFALNSLKSLKRQVNGSLKSFGILEAKGVAIESNKTGSDKKLTVLLSEPDPQDNSREIYYLAYFYQDGNSLKFRYKYNGELSEPEIIIPSTFIHYTVDIHFSYPESNQELTSEELEDDTLKNFLQAEGISEIHNGVKIDLNLVSPLGHDCSFSSSIYCRNFGD